jgi:hypothetical protein
VKLPTLNWVTIPPNKVHETIFKEIDDERVLAVLTCDQPDLLFSFA